jgi:hypothetical protein
VCLKLDSKLSIVPMEDVMEILQITRNGRMMNTLERFCIYNEIMLHSQLMTSAQINLLQHLMQ